METSERRTEIIRILCRRRHDTISNLAEEFGVSPRTIQRDIEILSLTEPIYTQCGRYGGGIYVAEDYSLNRMYMNDDEVALLQKIVQFANNKDQVDLSTEEYRLLKYIISQYTKPKVKKNKQICSL